MNLLGFDIGSSFIKVALVNLDTNDALIEKFPEHEMEIISHQPGWAEQDPEDWWKNLVAATQKIITRQDISSDNIAGIGIAYQMHGLVLIDKKQNVLRPSIIWCDGRAVDIGKEAFNEIGEDKCLKHFLNSPGNFTASKLKWIKENEPEVYQQVDKILLPGDYIAMRLTGESFTTISGLSEAILWDFISDQPASMILDQFGFDESLLPSVVEEFSEQGTLTPAAAAELGLKPGIPVTYRAGDQPNNAMALNVLNPGEVAVNGGTSGVIYAVVDEPIYDIRSRVNGFAHVNHTPENPRIGILGCINGAGIQYSWLKKEIGEEGNSYSEMDKMIETIPPNSEGLHILPFGNGAERLIDNKNIGSHIINLHFNRHSRAHIFRAGLEGIAFSFAYGFEIFKELGIAPDVIRAGHDNLFQSRLFSSILANLLGIPIEILDSNGATGAAKAAGIKVGEFKSAKEAFAGVDVINVITEDDNQTRYKEGYLEWKKDLNNILNQ